MVLLVFNVRLMHMASLRGGGSMDTSLKLASEYMELVIL